MKLIEHLEHVIRLVEGSAPYSEIKGALIAMHEEAAGQTDAAAKQVALVAENAALVSENQKLVETIAKLQAPAETPPKITLSIGPKFPRQPR